MILPPLGMTVRSPCSRARGVQVTCRIPGEAGGSPGELTIYDTAGRLVRRLADAVWTEGERTYTWNGTDECDAMAPAGVYVCQLS